MRVTPSSALCRATSFIATVSATTGSRSTPTRPSAPWRGSHFLSVVGRLKPGVTLEAASEDIAAVSRRLKEQYPNDNRYVDSVVVPIKEDVLGTTRTMLLVLMAAAGC